MDGIICPAGPCAGFPHGFRVWWGYFSIFNLLDYPSIILPIKDVKIDPAKDARDSSYSPRNNPFDAENWQICEFHSLVVGCLFLGHTTNLDLIDVDDPELWKNQPVTLQIVGRPCQDEELIAVTQSIDRICNGT